MTKLLINPLLSVVGVITLVCMLLPTTTSCQDRSQIIVDSITALISEADDLLLIRELYEKGIVHPQLKDEMLLEKLHDSGIKHFQGEDKLHLFHLGNRYAGKLVLLGNSKKGIEQYESIINDDDINNYKNYLSKALNGLSRLSSDKGEKIEALEYAERSINAVRDTEHHEALSQAYVEKSILYRNGGDFPQALTYIDSAIFQAKLISDNNNLLSRAYSTQGRIFRSLGDNENAKASYLQSEKICINRSDEYGLGTVYNNLGNLEHISGHYENAIAYYLKSLAFKEKHSNMRGMCIAYHNIGAIKVDLKDWEGAKAQFLKSQELAEAINLQNVIVHNYLKLGTVEQEQELYDASLAMFEKAHRLSVQVGFKSGEISANLGKGTALMELGQYDAATDLLLEGLKLAQNLGYKKQEGSYLVKLAQVYTLVQNDSRYTPTTDNPFSQIDIEALLNKANQLSDEMNNAENKLEALEGLATFYHQKDAHSKEAKILNEIVELKEQLFSDRRTKSIANWETKYATAEKEKEIVKLEAEKNIAELKKKTLRQWLYGSITFFICLFVVGYQLIRQRNEKKAAYQRELFRSKLSSDLHDDVGSILTGLAMQSELASNFADENLKKTLDRISTLSRDAMSRMRDTVWAIDSRKDTIVDLIDRMRDFGDDILSSKNIKILFDNKVDVSLRRISPELRQNIYLIYKEAMTNIAKYSDADTIKVKLYKEKSYLNLKIHDNGNVEEQNIKTSGLGSSNMRKRAENLGGSTNIYFDKSGYTVETQIPIS